MTHDFLNDFQIGFVFAEAGAERMPEMMAAKVGQKNRVTIFCISLGCFFLIIICADCMNRAIDHSRQIDLAFPRTEHKSRIAINFIRGESNHLLILIFFQKCVEHIIQHRDDTDACTGFRGVDMIRAGAIFLNAIDQIVIDTDRSIATVYKGNIIKNLIMDCQSYTKYRPNETTGGIFVSWRRKEELPTGA